MCSFSVCMVSHFCCHSRCQGCSHAGYRHPAAAVDLLATCPPLSPASSLITLAYWSSQGHGTLELKSGLHQLMTDYSSVGPWEQAAGEGTEHSEPVPLCSSIRTFHQLTWLQKGLKIAFCTFLLTWTFATQPAFSEISHRYCWNCEVGMTCW